LLNDENIKKNLYVHVSQIQSHEHVVE
jgi:hypothetical protein